MAQNQDKETKQFTLPDGFTPAEPKAAPNGESRRGSRSGGRSFSLPKEFSPPQEDTEDGDGVSRTLKESREELNMPTPDPSIFQQNLETAAQESTERTLSITPDESIRRQKGAQKVEQILKGDEAFNPVEVRRQAVEEIKGSYTELIDELKAEGDTTEAERLQTELKNIDSYGEQLYEAHKEEFRKTPGLSRLWGQLKKSASSLMLAKTGNAVFNQGRKEEIFDQIDQTGEIPTEATREVRGGRRQPIPEFRKYLNAPEEERQQIRDNLQKQAVDDLQKANQLRKAIQSVPVDPAAERFLSADSISEGLDALKDSPVQVLQEIIAGNAAIFSAFAVAGTAGGFTGSVAGGAGGPAGVVGGGKVGASAAIGGTARWFEMGNLIFEELEHRGVDLDDEDAVREAFKNEELIDEVRADVQKGANVYGFLTGLTGTIGGSRFIPKGDVTRVKNFIGREVSENITQSVLQGTLGAGAEAGSQLVRRGEIEDYGGVLAEFIAEGAFAAPRSFGIKKSIKAGRMSKAAHTEAEYMSLKKRIRAAEAERQAAVEADAPAKIREADIVLAKLEKARRNLLDNEKNQELIAERRADIVKKINKAERKSGAKGLQRPDIEIKTQEVQIIDEMASQSQPETTGESDATRQEESQETQEVQQGQRQQENEEAQAQTPSQEQEISDVGEPGADNDARDGGQRGADRVEPDPAPPAQADLGVTDQQTIDLAEANVGKKVRFMAEKPDGSGDRKATTRVLRKDEGGFFVNHNGKKNYLNMKPLEGAQDEGATLANVQLESGTIVEKGEVFQAESDVEGDTITVERDPDSEIFNEEVTLNEGGSVLEISQQEEGGRWGVTRLFVPENKRRQGSATRLLKRAMQELGGQEFVSQVSNEASAKLHYDLGFRAFDSEGNQLSLSETNQAIKDRTSVMMRAPEVDPTPNPDAGKNTSEIAKERLESVEKEINRFETLDNPTQADNDYLMELYEMQENLQTDPESAVPEPSKQKPEPSRADQAKDDPSLIDQIKEKYEDSKENWGVRNTIVSKEEANRIADRFAKNQANLHMGFSPQMVSDAVKWGVHQIEAGVREFSDFASIMINQFGEQVIPHLRTIYKQGVDQIVKSDPEFYNRTEFTDAPDIDAWYRDTFKKTDEETYSIADAATRLQRANELTDQKVRGMVEHEALMELAKAHMADSDGARSLLEFIEATKEQFPNEFSSSRIRSAYVAALSKTENEGRFSWPMRLHEKTDIPLGVLTAHVGKATWLRQKIQDHFIHVKRAQDAVVGERGGDYFRDEGERRDAYLTEDLMRGKVHEIQWEMTSTENPNSMFRLIAQEAANRGIDMGDWDTFYKSSKKALDLEQKGKTQEAEKLMAEAVEAVMNDDLNQYLHARHAQERNAYLLSVVNEKANERIAKLQEDLEALPDTPQNKDKRAAIKGQITKTRKKAKENAKKASRGSGLTDKQAQEILERFESEGKAEDLEAVAVKVDEMIDKTLDYRLEFGLNSQEEIQNYRDRYDKYVPLERILETDTGFILDSDEGGRSQASMIGARGIKGTGFKRAYGSDRPIDHILGTIATNFDTVVMAGAKNEVYNSLANFFDSEYALGNHTLGRTITKAAAEAANINEDNAMILDYRKQLDDGSVQDRRMIFEDKKIFETVAEYSAGKRDEALARGMNMFRGFMNYLRFVRTSASLNFMVTNPQRDIGLVMGNMASDFGHGASAKYLKDVFYKDGRFLSAQRDIWDFLQGKDTPGAKNYQELRRLGGTTGFYQFRDRGDILKDLKRAQSQINQIATGKFSAKESFKRVIRGIEHLNEIAENVTRLTAYNIAMEQGLSKRRAAQYSLNVNTNFNKSGDWGAVFKLVYQFANSAIQGHTRMARAAKINPRAFMQTASSLMMMGAAVNEYNDWMNEEAHTRLRKNHPWLFNTNLVFLNSKGDIAFKMYLPFGYMTFKSMGDQMHDFVTGRSDLETASKKAADAFMDSFNPFRGRDMFHGGLAGVLLAATPTAAEPFAEIGLNKGFFGSIYPPMKFALQERLDIPDYQLKYDNTNPYADYITRFLAREDVADLSPHTFEHLATFLSGSAGREWNNLFRRSLTTDEARLDGIDLGISTADGQQWKIRPNMIPILSRFTRFVDQDREAMSSIYNTILRDLPTKSFDVKGESFESVLDLLSNDYQTVLDNDIVDDDKKNDLQQAINAFVNTVHSNKVRDETIEYFRQNNLLGSENRRSRKRIYDRINQRSSATRVPHMTRTGSSRFRSDNYGTRNSKILSDRMIDDIELKVDDLKFNPEDEDE